jgi:hypothetical protein
VPLSKFFVIATSIVFVVLFNLGYVFHDLTFGPWFHEQEHEIAREEFIVPLVGLAFLVYAMILAHLFPIYRRAYPDAPLANLGLRFGILMGVVFDALQGGIIEYATFRMPFVVFVVDSSYHVLVEGSVAGLLLAACYRKWGGTTLG